MQIYNPPAYDYIRTQGNVEIVCDVYTIPEWNMSIEAFKDVNHSLDVTKVISVTAMIIRDNLTMSYPIDYSDACVVPDGNISVRDTFVRVRRKGGGFFDDVLLFGDLGFDRGHVLIWYIK